MMYLRGDNSILVPAIFQKLWLYLPRRLYNWMLEDDLDLD
jgi:hypothetical protein